MTTTGLSQWRQHLETETLKDHLQALDHEMQNSYRQLTLFFHESIDALERQQQTFFGFFEEFKEKVQLATEEWLQKQQSRREQVSESQEKIKNLEDQVHALENTRKKLEQEIEIHETNSKMLVKDLYEDRLEIKARQRMHFDFQRRHEKEITKLVESLKEELKKGNEELNRLNKEAGEMEENNVRVQRRIQRTNASFNTLNLSFASHSHSVPDLSNEWLPLF